MTVKSFEDLESWKKARSLAQQVRQATRRAEFSKDFALKLQINRSCGSIMDNIAEGFERDGTKELIAMLSYAKGSCGEARSQLYRALDCHYISEQEFEQIRAEMIAISRMLSSFIAYLKTSEYKGTKFKDRKT